MIGHYSFGSIKINGKEYTSDVIVYPEKIDTNWWRKEGHSLIPEDITEIIKYKPDVLIVGCGSSGCLAMPGPTKKFIEEQGIDLIELSTSEACKEFNKRLEKKERVVAALHLTC